MNLPRMPLLLIFTTLAVLGSCQNTWAQWAFLKASLQSDVQILEETASRLVLCRQDSTAVLIVTAQKASDSDLFAGIELRRGSNPYRVWVITEEFWKKPHLAKDGGKGFFQAAVVQMFRTEEAMRALAPAPPPEEKAPEIPAPISTETLAEKAEEEIPDEEPAVETIETGAVAADTLLQQAVQDSTLAVAKQPQPQKPARPARKTRKTSRSHRNTRVTQPAKGRLPKKQADQPPAAPAITPAPAVATLDSLYQVALGEIQNENWKQATVALESIQSLQPNFRDVADRLEQARMRLDMEAEPPPPVAPRQNISPTLFTSGAWAAAGAFVALIVLPMLGVILLSTGFRARFQMFRGNHAEAALLFEKKLARRPDKTKLYAELANAYLLLGRRDEQAIKVYKTVLQLKLDTKNHEAINAIVAQSYLAESRSDTNMIEVLENALRAERKRLGQGPEKQ
ncbi:MAG: hypothetical protein ACREOO_03195 [bacterium]